MFNISGKKPDHHTIMTQWEDLKDSTTKKKQPLIKFLLTACYADLTKQGDNTLALAEKQGILNLVPKFHQYYLNQKFIPYNSQETNIMATHRITGYDKKNNLSKKQYLKQIKNMFDDNSYDGMWLQFNGHGVSIGQNNFYLVYYETKYQTMNNVTYQRIQQSKIYLEEILQLWNPKTIKFLIVVLDNCYSGSGLHYLKKFYKYHPSISMITATSQRRHIQRQNSQLNQQQYQIEYLSQINSEGESRLGQQIIARNFITYFGYEKKITVQKKNSRSAYYMNTPFWLNYIGTHRNICQDQKRLNYYQERLTMSKEQYDWKLKKKQFDYSVYCGDLIKFKKADRFSGPGMLRHKDILFYEGNFQEGLFHGYGRLHFYSSGNTFYANFLKGRPSGCYYIVNQYLEKDIKPLQMRFKLLNVHYNPEKRFTTIHNQIFSHTSYCYNQKKFFDRLKISTQKNQELIVFLKERQTTNNEQITKKSTFSFGLEFWNRDIPTIDQSNFQIMKKKWTQNQQLLQNKLYLLILKKLFKKFGQAKIVDSYSIILEIYNREKKQKVLNFDRLFAELKIPFFPNHELQAFQDQNQTEKKMIYNGEVIESEQNTFYFAKAYQKKAGKQSVYEHYGKGMKFEPNPITTQQDI